MATFSYRGRKESGDLIQGTAEADDVESVATMLQQKGIIPVSIAANATPGQGITLKLPALVRKNVPLEEMILLCRQLHSLTRAGVVLNRAFSGLSESSRNPYLQTVLKEIEVSLNSGHNLSTALRKHPGVFNSLFVNIVQVGESTGRLDLCFQQLAIYFEQEKDTKRRIGAAVRYPLTVLMSLVAALIVVNIYVIPVFADMFSRFHTELPLPTRILLTTSSITTQYWPYLLGVALLMGAGIYHYVRTPQGKLVWDHWQLRTPLFGSILERASLGRFCRSFSMMLKTGVPLINGLELSAQAIGNEFMSMKIRQMRNGIQRGESLLRTAKDCRMFTPLVLQMIQVGEETGHMDEMLDEVAIFYEEEVDYQLKMLSSYIEPILIIIMAGMVMILALGIFLPMWDMMNVVK